MALRNQTFEDVPIVFRNFEGKEGTYNRKGDRNFSIILSPEQAEILQRDGWNVKFLKPKESDEEAEQRPYITVSVSYKQRPPKVAMVTSKKITYLTEAEVETLDWVDIETADVTLHPYEWSVNGNSGVKAYLQTLYIKIVEDYLQEKWTTFVEQNSPRQISASRTDYIDGELVEDAYLIEGSAD